MSNQNSDPRVSKQKKSDQSTSKRTGIRWTMVLYDVVLYLLCWTAIFVIGLSAAVLTVPVVALHLGVGFVIFFGFRLVFSCYKCIFRYGRMYAFAREILASTLAAAFLVLFSYVLTTFFLVADVPTVAVIAFVAMYVVASLMARFVYYYLYRYATEKETKLAHSLRWLLSTFAFVDFDSKKPGATRSLIPERPQNPSPINDLQNIAERFVIHGDITSIEQINKGYINRTYKVETLSEAGHIHQYILQRINTNVFPDVPALMSNFELTTRHLAEKLQLPGSHRRGTVQTLRPTKDGELFYRDDSGSWRLMTYFDNVYSMDIPDSPEVFYYAGVSFGRFVKDMADVNADEIKVVIPNFHNTKSRYLDLEKSIARDPKKRVQDVMPEIEFIRARADRFDMISKALEDGTIPTRICHNDCNLNNILFDEETHLPVAIIDLDTVMPSSPLYDYGDSMRIGTNTAKDDEKDLSKVSCNLELYEQYARGYLESCGDVLTKEELALLPYASLIITSEDGIRFLMDHIDGDTYYHIYYPGQNLDRSRTQLKLVEDMERKLPEIKEILRKIYAELGLEAEIV